MQVEPAVRACVFVCMRVWEYASIRPEVTQEYRWTLTYLDVVSEIFRSEFQNNVAYRPWYFRSLDEQ